MKQESAQDWEKRYQDNDIGWDIGYPSTPLKEYIDQLKNKNLKVLIPGCGNGYEGEYLHQQGFTNIFLSDLAESAKANFLERVPTFPEENFVVGDFFAIDQKFDLIIEQTFYCALPPTMRNDYLKKMGELIHSGGKLVGLLFTFPLTEQGPPFGGKVAVYKETFSQYFKLKTIEESYNSIPQRQGSEVFFIAEKE